MTATWHNAVCPHDCPSACALEVEKLGADRIGKVRGSPHQPYTAGLICAKVAKYAERIHSPDRVTQPLLRVSGKHETARFQPIAWDEALDRVAQQFNDADKQYGAESVWPYYYGGTMGAVQRDGILRLQHTMGYSGLKKTFCVQIAYDGWLAGTGTILGTDPREIADSKLAVLWGCNAAATQINLMHHVSLARKRGARLVVVDPYQTPTAKVADLHLAPRPGTDGALACAVMHLLFQRGHADRQYLARYTDDPAALEAHLQPRGPAWAAEICDIPVHQIEQFAEWYGECKNSYIRLGIGFSRQRNGAANVHAVACLPAITGAWQHQGGGALIATSDSFALQDELITAASLADSRVRVLDMSLIGSILCGDKTALRHGPPVKAMLIQNTNPMLVAPDLATVRRGFLRDDLFVCVHEHFLTETANLADIVLPATMFAEHDDLYRSYGQTFLQYGAKVIDRPGQCRSNHELICQLADRLGARHAGFELSANQLIDRCLQHSGYPDKHRFSRGHFHDCAPAFEQMHFLNGFAWPEKKFRFKPDWAAIGPWGKNMPTMPDHWDVIDNTSEDKPLRLIAAPSRGYLNSTFNRSPSSIKREKQPQVKLHPDTAATYRLTPGQPVKVGNERGEVTVQVSVIDRIQRDTAVVEGIWPAAAFPENIGINVLISAEPAAPNGGAVFHDTAVWIRPL